MELDGEILEVMESWPLQLAVQSSAGIFQVQLKVDTSLIQVGQLVDPGILRPGERLRIKGREIASKPLSMIADHIEIL